MTEVVHVDDYDYLAVAVFAVPGSGHVAGGFRVVAPGLAARAPARSIVVGTKQTLNGSVSASATAASSLGDVERGNYGRTAPGFVEGRAYTVMTTFP